MNVASVPPHMRQATMQTEGLCRIHRDFRTIDSATEHNMLVLSEKWSDTIKHQEENLPSRHQDQPKTVK